MSPQSEPKHERAAQEAAKRLQEAAAAKKCWTCGCLHSSLAAIERALPEGARSAELAAAIAAAQSRLQATRYDCLGCEVCYPALAVNALNAAGHSIGIEPCPTEAAEPRHGWPPLPGAYQALRYRAPVAVCTLTDDQLMQQVAQESPAAVSIVGTLQTENLGIERVITNLLANPHVRFLVVCGADSRQAIGHLPGQSLVALAKSGLGEHQQIVGARGKRPIIRNLPREAVEHFRKTVEVIDLVGQTDLPTVIKAIQASGRRDPGPAEPYSRERLITPQAGYIPQSMVPDLAGYFVVYVDCPRKVLQVEHYRNDGVLDTVIEGKTAAELYLPAIERGLISRLDHAAYLGRELARAEAALRNGEPYVQDAAPQAAGKASVEAACDCSTPCGNQDAIKRWLAILTLMVIIVGAAFSVGLWKRANVSATTANAGELPAGILGVETLMKNAQRSPETIWVEGVVAAITPQKQMLALIDTKEFEECGITTCAALTLPVRWMGLFPKIRERVWVWGQVEEADGKLVFVAQRVELKPPKGDPTQ